MKNKKVEALYIKDIAPHEEYNEAHLKHLKNIILREGILRRPILVDEETGMIIDGTHRYTILERMGFEAVPALTVDYLEEEIVIMPWNRVYSGFDSRGLEFGSDGEVRIYFNGKATHVSKPYRSNDAIKHIDTINADRLIKYVRHIPEEREFIVVTYKPPSRYEVIEIFKSGLRFPPKFTRHIIKNIEIPEINIPLLDLISIYRLEKRLSKV